MTKRKPNFRIQQACEIENLLAVVSYKTGLTAAEVEMAAFDQALFPEGEKTFFAVKYASKHWLEREIAEILLDHGLDSIYITEAI